MKPEDIPVIVWSKAFNIVSDMELSFELNHENHLVISHAIARAILQARSQAYAECAKIADDTKMPSEYSNSWHLGFRAGKEAVLQAIRSKANQ